MQMRKQIEEKQIKELKALLCGQDGMALWRLLQGLGLDPNDIPVRGTAIKMYSVGLSTHRGGTLLYYFSH